MITAAEIFIDLVQQNKGIVYKVSRVYATGADREDLAQEIVYNLWKSYQTYDASFKFTTWMYRVALNVAISYYKKNKYTKHIREQLQSEPVLITEDNSDEIVELETRYEQMFRIIADLRKIDRSIVFLYLEQKSYREIAEITGISESNVSTRMARIRKKLKLKLSITMADSKSPP